MGEGLIKVRRAVLSVAKKDGVAEFAAGLAGCDVELLSTGGTGASLQQAGIDYTDVASVTGAGAALNGRIKTLHPSLLGGILHDRDIDGQADELEGLGAKPIDLVAVNFYPFAQGAKAGKEIADLVELVDVGGPTMVRSAAKNHRHVVAVTDPCDYDDVLAALKANDGCVPRSLARDLASKAFAMTARYEAEIAAAFAGGKASGSTGELLDSLLGLRELSYGENPHQRGWRGGAANLRQIGGGQLSYNNLQDAVAAWRCVAEHAKPCCAIIKHANPCGVALGATLAEAHAKALAADPVSAYGGVVACNGEVDAQALSAVKQVFCEVLVAASYTDEAAASLAKAKRLKSIQGPLGGGDIDAKILGGLSLVQQRDRSDESMESLRQVTKRAPSDAQLSELLFAWRVAKHVRSNAIVLSSDSSSVGIGAGQSSRVEAVRLAVSRAREKGFNPASAVAASDAFFPFADGVESLVAAGVQAIVQPGGSKRDAEVIDCADSANIVMLFTGVRHFVH